MSCLLPRDKGSAVGEPLSTLLLEIFADVLAVYVAIKQATRRTRARSVSARDSTKTRARARASGRARGRVGEGEMDVDEDEEGVDDDDDGDMDQAVDDDEEKGDGGGGRGGLDVFLAGHYAVLHSFLSSAHTAPSQSSSSEDKGSDMEVEEHQEGTEAPGGGGEGHIFHTLVNPSLEALERSMGKILACCRRNAPVAMALQPLHPLPSGFLQVTPLPPCLNITPLVLTLALVCSACRSGQGTIHHPHDAPPPPPPLPPPLRPRFYGSNGTQWGGEMTTPLPLPTPLLAPAPALALAPPALALATSTHSWSLSSDVPIGSFQGNPCPSPCSG